MTSNKKEEEQSIMRESVKTPIRNIACIGAGVVGRAWAVVFARAGYTVALFDKDVEKLKSETVPTIKKSLEGFVKGEKELAQVVSRIKIEDRLQTAVENADYVQESIIENANIKRNLFSDIAKHAPKHCILASSTSAIMGSEFLGDIIYPERALVAHPVNPPSHIPLVEICATKWTNSETVETTKTFLTDIGMTPVIVKKEIEGFLLNRLQYTLVAEALHLIGEGYCDPEDIDLVMTDGLARRWSFIGPMMVAHLNSDKGFRGFVDQLGPMMREMGEKAQTDYDWDTHLIDRIHETLAKSVSLNDIPEKQSWRDEQLAFRNARKQ